MGFIQDIKDVKRLEEIVAILVKYELGYWVHRLHLKRHLKFFHKIKALKAQPEHDQRDAARKLTLAIEELGPTFIKLGQLLSLRSDLIPDVFCEEFRKLQNHVPPIPYQDIKNVIETQMGKNLGEIFKEFDKTPVASASIAQVHKAKTDDGKNVAVKIQRPHIASLIKTDIDILYHIARIMQSKPEFKNFNPLGVVREFESYTKNELDFEIEAKNAERFVRNFKDTDSVFIPQPVQQLCTKRVLVTEWIDGISLSDTKAIIKHHVNRKTIALNGMNSIFDMIFEHRFFHADSHPGNIFVMKGGKIAYVDFGIVGQVTEEMKDKLLLFMVAITDYDVPLIRKYCLEIAQAQGEVDLEGFTTNIDRIVGDWYGSKLGDVRITQMLYKLINSCAQFNLKMPVDVILLAKALLTMEGTGVELYPQFDLVKEAKPRLQKMKSEQYNPRKLLGQSEKEFAEFHELVTHIPERTEHFMDLIDKGKLGMKIDARDLRVITEEIDHHANTRSLAMIFTGLVIASTIALLSPMAYRILGMQVSTFGFLGAMIIAAIYIASIIRHQEYKRLY